MYALRTSTGWSAFPEAGSCVGIHVKHAGLVARSRVELLWGGVHAWACVHRLPLPPATASPLRLPLWSTYALVPQRTSITVLWCPGPGAVGVACYAHVQQSHTVAPFILLGEISGPVALPAASCFPVIATHPVRPHGLLFYEAREARAPGTLQ